MPQTRAEPAQPVLQVRHVEPLIAHLDVEESLMREAKAVLVQHSRSAGVLTRDDETKLDALLSRLVETSRQRASIVESYARVLQLAPEDMQLRAIMRRSSPDAAMLVSEARRRIRRLARELQQLSATAAWILQQSRQISLALMDVVATDQSSRRYDASGHVTFTPDTVRAETRS